MSKVLDEDGVVILTSDIKALADATYATVDGIRENLLDNWYFVGGGSQQGGGQFPINQRGQTSYTGSAAYTLDRWKLQYDTNLQVLSAGTKISGKWDIQQYINHLHLPSAIYTATLLLSDYSSASSIRIEINDTVHGTTLAQSSGNNNGLITVTMASAGVPDKISINLADSSGNSEATITAVKLELGDTQTLAHQENGTWVLNEIPNYEEQLLRCQTSTADSSDYYTNQTIMTNQKITNPNLLDNWYFVGGGSQQGGGQFPINQRGQTSYTGSAYGIDRFLCESGATATVNSGYVTFTGTTIQLIPLAELKDLVGKTVTISALQYYNGNLYLKSKSGVVNAYTSDTEIGVNLEDSGAVMFRIFSQAQSYQGCRIYGGSGSNSVNLVAVKLELGNIQTLAHQENGIWVLNEIPDYSEQLYRCCASLANSNDTYANHPYSVPTVISITLTAANWVGSLGIIYAQTVSVSGGTPNSKVDLQPEEGNIRRLLRDGVSALYIKNESGTFKAIAVGAAPTENMTIQATRTEVTT